MKVIKGITCAIWTGLIAFALWNQKVSLGVSILAMFTCVVYCLKDAISEEK